jgi:hypothetical protein
MNRTIICLLYFFTPVQSFAQSWTPSRPNIYFTGGNVGIGTFSPAYLLDVNGTAMMSGVNANIDPAGGFTFRSLTNTGRMMVALNRSGSFGETDLIANRGPGGIGGFSFFNYSNSGTLTNLYNITGNGSVGIGMVRDLWRITTTP